MILIVAVWFAVGAGGFVYWWTTDHDLTVSDLFLLPITGIIGPFSWIVGWTIHGKRENRPPRVLVKKRSR